MFVETKRTQDKLRDLLHDQGCWSDGCDYVDGQGSTCWRRANRDAVLVLGKLMPVISGEMFPLVRADERGRVAGRIEAELVCCDLYERINSAKPEDHRLTEKHWSMLSPKVAAGQLGLDWHAICHWAGYAASLARSEPKREGKDDDHGGDRG